MRTTLLLLFVFVLVGCEQTSAPKEQKAVTMNFESLPMLANVTKLPSSATTFEFAGKPVRAVAWAELSNYLEAEKSKLHFTPLGIVPNDNDIRKALQTAFSLVCGSTVYVVTGCPDGSTSRSGNGCLTIYPPSGSARGMCCPD